MDNDLTENRKFGEVFMKVLSVFQDDMDNALSWINSPCSELDDQVPIYLLDSDDSLKLVMEELERLKQK
jgi:uncharacterized protein (DUF2384 family)